MTEIISVKDFEQDVNIIERLQREVEARCAILAYMVETGAKDTKNYQDYYEEFLAYRQAYGIAKDNFIKEKIQPMYDKLIQNWELNFEAKELVIDV